jgi:hypothetical protein
MNHFASALTILESVKISWNGTQGLDHAIRAIIDHLQQAQAENQRLREKLAVAETTLEDAVLKMERTGQDLTEQSWALRQKLGFR